MITLKNLAYMRCDDDEKAFYDDLGTLKISIDNCCKLVLTDITRDPNSQGK